MPAPRVAYNKTGEERTTFTYQQSGFTYYKWTPTYEERNSFDEQSHTAPWQRRKTSPLGSWKNTSKVNFDSNSQIGGPYEYRINSSGWVSSTKALYHASNTNPTDTDGWKRSNPSGSWVAMTGLAQYNANNTTADESDGVRIGASVWNPISKPTYDGANTTNDDTDGYRRVSNGSFSGSISKATYDANNTTQDSSDGFRRINPSGAWVSITEADYNARNTTSDETDGVRPGPDVDNPSGTYFHNAVTQTKRNAGILARLISGNFNGEPWTGSLNTNERVANMFVEPNWTHVPAALKAVALGECGGTLTLQTKVGSTYAADAFEYQNTAITDSSGNPLTSNENTVITNSTVKAVTFDFDMADGLHRIIEIEPLDSSDLLEAGYTGGSWSCKAGVTNRPVVTYPIPGTVWTGVRVQVGANEAVSCIHSVTVS